MGSIGTTINSIQRPVTTKDYKLTPADITTLRVLFEAHDEGTGATLARKFARAEQLGRTDVYMTFLEKDFAGYKLEGNPTDEEVVALEKVFKRKYKEMFDRYWEEQKRRK